MFTTKLTIELEIQTQFGPAGAMQLVSNLLVPVPAVTAVRVTSAATDCHEINPHPSNFNLLALKDIPRQLK